MGRLPDSYQRIEVPPFRSWYAWTLSDHYERDAYSGSRPRTYLGDLVYRAKYNSDRRAVDDLKRAIRHGVLQLHQMPRSDALGSVTAVVAVPCHPPKPVSVPHVIAAVAAEALGVPDLSSVVVKARATPPAKTSPGRLQPEAYEVLRRLDGESVLLVDDLYRTGATLESVAHHMRAAGAAHVVGLCATKVFKGMAS